MAKGQCNCGSVAFEVDGDMSGIYVCHCSICRRATGSNGIAVLVVNNDAFQWIRGEDLIATWKKPDADWEMWFCHQCGSPLPGTNNDTTLFIPAGLITEGGESLKVTDHLYVDSRAHWDEIGDSGRQHREGYER